MDLRRHPPRRRDVQRPRGAPGHARGRARRAGPATAPPHAGPSHGAARDGLRMRGDARLLAGGGVLSGGVCQRVGDWLDGPGGSGGSGGRIAGPPAVLTWQASVIPVLLAPWCCCWRAGPPCTCGATPGDSPTTWRPGTPRRCPTRPAPAGSPPRSPAPASPTGHPGWWAAVAAATLVMGGAAVLGTLLTGQVPGRATDGAPGVVAGTADAVQALGSWLVGFAFVLLLAWGAAAPTGTPRPAAPSASCGTWAPSGRAAPTRSRRPATPSAPCPTWPGGWRCGPTGGPSGAW